MYNQEIKADAGKPRLSLVPTEIINCIARVREYGVNKYHAVDSWKEVEKERYIDALYRHLLKYINDNGSIDEESGLPHLWHIACNVAFLCEMEKYSRDDSCVETTCYYNNNCICTSLSTKTDADLGKECPLFMED